ncbi:MAG: anaerobic ribonucleoside-triphosphate reductase activating protein [Candidatus Parcubacteria bacterium]|nr:anaerobic ribonucleoside-triphosphate reductase activating protein [Candidatus Parcubacteria bacterium]
MIKIAGLQKMTLMDYPGKVAAAVFLAGCNFRCGFCHNPQIVEIKPGQETISEQEFFDFLKNRQGLLDGVCVSGGEPLIHQELPEFLRQIKDLGFAIKLDTNGLNFSLLQEILDEHLVDYIAMDIKASLENYGLVTKTASDFNNILQSIKLIMASGMGYEFRTTVLPRFHNSAEMEKIGQMISGAKKYYLQNFRNQKTLDPKLREDNCFTEKELENLRQIAAKYVGQCEIRN